MQSPEMLGDSQCADCNIRENLWICLICGRVGCGRYGRKHAQLHFEETGHTFALELGKTLVWDYADDAYVHRLAVNHEDGKLVQVSFASLNHSYCSCFICVCINSPLFLLGRTIVNN